MKLITGCGGSKPRNTRPGFDCYAAEIIAASRWYNAGVSPQCSPQEWDTYLRSRPQAHLLQTPQWGSLKSAYGWDVEHIMSNDCGAQVLLRRLPLGFTLAYVPKGPVGDWLPSLLPELDSLCKRRRALTLKVEPDADWHADYETRLLENGFMPSAHQVQPTNTIVIDIQAGEEQILSRMHQKTRYNIRLASRKDVSVRPWDDLDSFGRMMLETSERDSFGVHIPAYYRQAFDTFYPSGSCELFVAEYDGQPLAAIMVFARGERAWYFYGASTNLHRNRMPTYLLQWEAIRWARTRGCTHYDLWGVPDGDRETLESTFQHRDDGLWGVYRFKRGFGGTLVSSMGAWDRPQIRPLYSLYRAWTNLRIE